MQHNWIEITKPAFLSLTDEYHKCSTCGCERMTLIWGPDETEYLYFRSRISFQDREPQCIDWSKTDSLEEDIKTETNAETRTTNTH